MMGNGMEVSIHDGQWNGVQEDYWDGHTIYS